MIIPAQAADGQETSPDTEPAERTMITLGLEGVPHGQVGVIDAADLLGRDPAALITSLEDRIRRLPGHKVFIDIHFPIKIFTPPPPPCVLSFFLWMVSSVRSMSNR